MSMVHDEVGIILMPVWSQFSINLGETSSILTTDITSLKNECFIFSKSALLCSKQLLPFSLQNSWGVTWHRPNPYLLLQAHQIQQVSSSISHSSLLVLVSWLLSAILNKVNVDHERRASRRAKSANKYRVIDYLSMRK